MVVAILAILVFMRIAHIHIVIDDCATSRGMRLTVVDTRPKEIYFTFNPFTSKLDKAVNSMRIKYFSALRDMPRKVHVESAVGIAPDLYLQSNNALTIALCGKSHEIRAFKPTKDMNWDKWTSSESRVKSGCIGMLLGDENINEGSAEEIYGCFNPKIIEDGENNKLQDYRNGKYFAYNQVYRINQNGGNYVLIECILCADKNSTINRLIVYKMKNDKYSKVFDCYSNPKDNARFYRDDANLLITTKSKHFKINM